MSHHIANGLKVRTPCEKCPWRISFDGEIPGYDDGLHQRLVETCDGDGWAVMACHHSGDEPFACAGYMVQVGFAAIGPRLLARAGTDYPHNYGDGGLELHPDLAATLDAYRERAR